MSGRAAVDRVLEYIAAEMDAASPSSVVAYCETTTGIVVELTLSDLVSVAYMATNPDDEQESGR